MRGGQADVPELWVEQGRHAADARAPDGSAVQAADAPGSVRHVGAGHLADGDGELQGHAGHRRPRWADRRRRLMAQPSRDRRLQAVGGACLPAMRLRLEARAGRARAGSFRARRLTDRTTPAAVWTRRRTVSESPNAEGVPAMPANSKDAWNEVGQRFSDLGDRLAERYRALGDESGESAEEGRRKVEEALKGVRDQLDRAFTSVGETM